jgi:hypothetical protein
LVARTANRGSRIWVTNWHLRIHAVSSIPNPFPVSAGGICSLPRLRWPFGRQEVGKTVDLMLAGSLGPRLGAASSQKNKSLRPHSRHGGANSGAFVRYVRVRSSGSSSLDLWRICTGVRGCLLLLLPVKELMMAAATSFVKGEGIASGVAVVWRVDLGLFYGALRRHGMVLGQVGVRCFTVRWTITGDFLLFLVTGFCCGSFQS